MNTLMMRVLMGAFAIAFTHATDAQDISSCSAAGSCEQEDVNAANFEDANFIQTSRAQKKVIGLRQTLAEQSKAIANCGSLPAFSSSACPEDTLCTYTEDKDGLTFTFERAEGVGKIAFESGHALYMVDGSLVLRSPCHAGETIKTDVEDTTSHAMTCSDNTVRDVGPDTIVQLTATANGVDVFEAAMTGDAPLQDHFQLKSSSPRQGAIDVPSGSNLVSREEFAGRLDQIAQGCPSLMESQSLSKSLDGAVSRKWNPGQWVGAITMGVGGVLMVGTFFGCGPPCFGAGLTIMSIGGKTYHRSR
jgi:hypothetical protein